MPPLKTRPCTEVYTERPAPDHVPRFLEREIQKIEAFSQERVKGRPYLPKDRVRDLIKELIQVSIRESKRAKRLASLQQTLSTARPRLSWKDQVNQKRRFVAACIQNQQKLNLKQVAKFTKSCLKTVQKVYWDLVHNRAPDTYEYNNLKDPSEVQALESDIRTADGVFSSVADLKRKNPTFSRKKILEELHSRDLRWRKLPLAQPKVLHYDPPDKTLVNRVICNMAQIHNAPDAQMLYVDEMKFPLLQTAKYHWIHKDSESEVKLNRREVLERSFTAIALCSTQRFVAVQLFEGEITGQDFLNFLNGAISSLPTDKKYLILADNATWHNSGLIQRTEAYKFLFFNQPRMFQINLIENAFSAVRAEFRKRDLVDKLELEAKQVVNLFFRDETGDRFQGYWRNHLRMLDKYLT